MKEESFILEGDEYTESILMQAKLFHKVKVFYKDERRDKEASLVMDKYGRLWLYYTFWEELYDNQETYFSLVKNEEDAMEVFNGRGHRAPCCSMSSYGMFRFNER